MYLLTSANYKMAKSVEKGYLSVILHLQPYKNEINGKNVCPGSTEGCRVCCLNTAGRGQFDMTQAARTVRTVAYWQDKKLFVKQLKKEIKQQIDRAKRSGLKLSVRLNGTSDISWELIDRTLFTDFPDVKFYDYTKNPKRDFKNLPKNYNLTFSLSEKNEEIAKKLFRQGVNVAVVFRKVLPKKFWNSPVINGDDHDLRFLDRKGCIVGLSAKGKARKDTTGFVQDIAV
jgi:hypothetical protein